jgi:hypothetical protein
MASIELRQRSKLTGKDNYGTWRISTEMALNKLKAWRVINEEAPVTPDFYKNDAALDGACKEWLLETFEEEEVTGQKVISNRKKFKKQLAVEYREWQELNGIALSEIYDSCSHSIQILIGENRVAAEVWKQLKSCYSVSGYAAVEQYVLVVQELSYASCKSLQDFISQLKTTKERLEALSVSMPQSFYVVNLLRGLGRPFQSWAREVRHMDLNNLDFDTLCSKAFNEEQSIKRGEEESNTNRGSALSTKKEKGSQNRSQQDSEENGGALKRLRCQTHKTNDHAWYDCPENPKNKNKGEGVKKEAGANLATLNLDGLPADLLVQLDQIGVLQRGSASAITGTIRDREDRFGGAWKTSNLSV